MTKTTIIFPSQLTRACENIHNSCCEELYHVSLQITFTSLQLTTPLRRIHIKFLTAFPLNFVFCGIASNRKQLLWHVIASCALQHPWWIKTKFSHAKCWRFSMRWEKEIFLHHSIIKQKWKIDLNEHLKYSSHNTPDCTLTWTPFTSWTPTFRL